MQGTIILTSIDPTTVKKGQVVIYRVGGIRTKGIIEQVIDENHVHLYGFKSGNNHEIQRELQTLAIQYKKYTVPNSTESLRLEEGESYLETVPLMYVQWEEILKRDLINRNIEFKFKYRVNNEWKEVLLPSEWSEENKKVGIVIFEKGTKIIYTENEAQKLVLSAWHDGWNSCNEKRGDMPDKFWLENKKV